MATRRTTKSGIVIDAENNAPRRTTKSGAIVDAENNSPARTTKTGVIVATAPKVPAGGGVFPRFWIDMMEVDYDQDFDERLGEPL